MLTITGPHTRTQIGYVISDRLTANETIQKGDFARTRKTKGYLVIESDGYERWFDTRKAADKWVTEYESGE